MFDCISLIIPDLEHHHVGQKITLTDKTSGIKVGMQVIAKGCRCMNILISTNKNKVSRMFIDFAKKKTISCTGWKDGKHITTRDFMGLPIKKNLDESSIDYNEDVLIRQIKVSS